jgi:hypothetical protein
LTRVGGQTYTYCVGEFRICLRELLSGRRNGVKGILVLYLEAKYPHICAHWLEMTSLQLMFIPIWC